MFFYFNYSFFLSFLKLIFNIYFDSFYKYANLIIGNFYIKKNILKVIFFSPIHL